MIKHFRSHIFGMLVATTSIAMAAVSFAQIGPKTPLNCGNVGTFSCDRSQCNITPYGDPYNCCLTYCNPFYQSGGCCSMQCRATTCTKKYTNSTGCDPQFKNERVNIIQHSNKQCGASGTCVTGTPNCDFSEPSNG